MWGSVKGLKSSVPRTLTGSVLLGSRIVKGTGSGRRGKDYKVKEGECGKEVVH